MSISPIYGSGMLQNISGIRPQEAQGAMGELPFQNMFQSLLTEINALETQKSQDGLDLALGDVDDPAVLTLTSTKADLAITTLVEMRNKLLDAYSEIMRISV